VVKTVLAGKVVCVLAAVKWLEEAAVVRVMRPADMLVTVNRAAYVREGAPGKDVRVQHLGRGENLHSDMRPTG